MARRIKLGKRKLDKLASKVEEFIEQGKEFEAKKYAIMRGVNINIQYDREIIYTSPFEGERNVYELVINVELQDINSDRSLHLTLFPSKIEKRKKEKKIKEDCGKLEEKLEKMRCLEFKDVVLYAPNGRPFATYERIKIPHSVETFGPKLLPWEFDDQFKYFNKSVWLSFPLFYHALEWAWKNGNKRKAQLIQNSFQEDYYNERYSRSSEGFYFGTRFKFDLKGGDRVIHHVKGKEKPVSLATTIPPGCWRRLRDVQNSCEWQHFLRALTGKQDVSVMADVLKWFSGRECYINAKTEEKCLMDRIMDSGIQVAMVSCYAFGAPHGAFQINCAKPYHDTRDSCYARVAFIP